MGSSVLCVDQVTSLPGEALESIAAGLARVDRQVPTRDGDEPGAPRSVRLISTDAYDVWLITWPPGSGIDQHDHAGSASVLRVVIGSITECTASGVRQFGPGVSAVSPPRAVHRLRNDGPGDCTTLHVYSPPLEELTYQISDLARVLHPAGGSLGPRKRRIEPGWAEASTVARRRLSSTGDAVPSGAGSIRRAGP
jgi:quercetin dioxygenase-like cupin family protein